VEAVAEAVTKHRYLADRLNKAFGSAKAVGRTGEIELFTAALELFDALCRGCGLKPFLTLARTLRTWRERGPQLRQDRWRVERLRRSAHLLVKNQRRQATSLYDRSPEARESGSCNACSRRARKVTFLATPARGVPEPPW
jgi:hypothetical protein